MPTKQSHSKYIESPDKLWQLFTDYVKHEQSNPYHKVDYVGKNGERVLTPLPTPITFVGFECYLADKGIINSLGDYSSNKGGKYSDYSTIITRIQNNCYVQNFKGAAVGLFNPNLIARKLGLTDKVEQTIIEQPIFNLDELSDNNSDKENI